MSDIETDIGTDVRTAYRTASRDETNMDPLSGTSVLNGIPVTVVPA